MAQGRDTAVVADEWPLLRLGVAQALTDCGITVLAQLAQGEPAAHRAAGGGATYLVVGAVRDASLPDVVAKAAPARVVVLLDRAEREELAGALALGASALLPRAATPDELEQALGRVAEGERYLSPSLLPLLVGLLEAAPAVRGAPAGLTHREVEVLVLLAAGMSNRAMARALYVSEATVKTHLANIYAKLGVRDRREAAARAVALGVLS